MDDKKDKIEPIDGRIAAALFGAFILGTVLVVVLGFAHLKNIENAPWQFYMTVVNSIIGVASMVLIAVGCIRGVIRHARQRRWPTCVAFGAGALFGALWAVKELVIVYRDGFPLDPLTRTLFLVLWLIAGMYLCFPSRIPDEKLPEGDKPKPEDKPLSLGWGGALLVVLAALFLAYQDGFIDVLRLQPQPEQASTGTPAPAPATLAPPASFEEIAKACVVVCSVGGKKPPCGSGVFVGIGPMGEKPRIFLLTAAHVVQGVTGGTATNAIAFIVHRQNEETDLRKTVFPDGKGWIWPGGENDIAAVDVTGAFDRMLNEGLDVKYVYCTVLPVDNVPEHAVKGALAVRHELFDKYNIGLGTEIRALGMATELWHINAPKERVRQPLALRAGVIATRHDTPLLAGASKGSFIIDARLAPGFSGGPVFALVRHGYLEYPALVGVCLGSVRGYSFDNDDKPRTIDESVQSAYGVVTPLDEMFMYTSFVPKSAGE